MFKGIQKKTELLQQLQVNNNITSKSHFEQNFDSIYDHSKHTCILVHINKLNLKMNTTDAAWLHACKIGGFQPGSYVDETRQFFSQNLHEKISKY